MKVTKKLPIFHKCKLDGKLDGMGWDTLAGTGVATARQTIDDKNDCTDVDKIINFVVHMTTSQVLHTIKCVRQTMHFI